MSNYFVIDQFRQGNGTALHFNTPRLDRTRIVSERLELFQYVLALIDSSQEQDPFDHAFCLVFE